MAKKYVKRGKKTYRRVKKPYKKPMRYEVADMAYSAWKGVKYLKDLVNIETKFFDAPYSALTTNAGAVTTLCNIAQGTAQSQRVGDSVKLQTLSFRGVINGNTGSPYAATRIIIFKGDSENAVVPPVNQILQGGQLFDHKTYSDRYRTRILYDRTYVTSNITTIAYPLEFSFPLNFHCNFVPGLSTIEDGGIYMLLITDAAVNVPSFFGTYRVLYTDD